jgi:hypothetical protein
VTGTVTNVDQLSILAETTASEARFEGGAAGVVSTAGNDSHIVSAATGGMRMSWNFASQEGLLNIDQFGSGSDRYDFTYVLRQNEGYATFLGNRVDGNSDVSEAVGAFVSDGSMVAAGVIGNFEAVQSFSDNGTIRATGVFGGTRTSLTVPEVPPVPITPPVPEL